MADEAGEQIRGAKPSADDLRPEAASLPQEYNAPLAPFAGEPPPGPAWFDRALANAPERALVPTPRGRIETLSWGQRGKPGLLFVHGDAAHADWWSFIGPMFAADYRVCAMSLAGMGDSDWRDHYGYVDFADDAEAAARACGLYEGGGKPVYIGHSFGGRQVFYAASRRAEQMRAAIMIDVGFRGQPPGPPPDRTLNRIYPSLPEALARFRLAPPQPVENLYILDLLARRGLRRVAEGWTWKFDPQMWGKFDRETANAFIATPPKVDLPLAHVYGEYGSRRPPSDLQDPYPADGLLVCVPDAHHHVMVDQPLALVTAIAALLAGWRA
jgi:pimeloyl-ACP methyl ester carboxylesterase